MKTILKKLIFKIKNSDFYKTYKEELVAIPVLLLLYYILNSVFIKLFPNSAFFDYISEVETIISRAIRVIIALFIAHISLRMSFPVVYKHLHESLYDKFNELGEKTKDNYAVCFILVFIITTALIFAAK